MDFKLTRHRTDKISREKILEELVAVAKKCNLEKFGKRDFNKIGKLTSGTVVREFGTWTNAIEVLSKHLKEKFGLELTTSSIPKNRTYSDKDLFEEMGRLWILLEHRPSRNEWETNNPKISYNTYRHRFNGWINACHKFIELKTGDYISYETKKDSKPITKNLNRVVKKDKRDIPLGLRIKILTRDKFCCVFCGHSPSTMFGIKLHIDHIIPIAKGGKTEENNLRTLCSDCNLGKSDKLIEK
jgi:hypothetical protein